MADRKTTGTKKRPTSAGERATGARRRREAPPTEADDGATRGAHVGHDAGVCPVAFCPIGAALSAAQQVRPDTVEHLLLAGRELMLAAKAVLDARLEDVPENGSALERIEIG